MSRLQRAIAHTDLDAYARSRGVRDAAEYAALLQLHRRLDAGGRITPADIEAAHRRGSGSVEGLNQISDYVMAGATPRERADRYASCISHAIESITGNPINHALVREQARHEAEHFAVQEFAMPLTQQLDERNAHRDRQMGIDESRRVEAAKRAAATNPEAVRRADIEREVSRHTGGEPTLYAHQRREIYAQQHDQLADRYRQQMVRDADPNRRPDRGDDRRDDIRLAVDAHALEPLSRDEIALAGNPTLESVDNAMTHAASMERD